jgi:hypothetical protein
VPRGFVARLLLPVERAATRGVVTLPSVEVP